MNFPIDEVLLAVSTRFREREIRPFRTGPSECDFAPQSEIIV